MEELDKMYQTALEAERERYEILLQERMDQLKKEVYDRFSRQRD